MLFKVTIKYFYLEILPFFCINAIELNTLISLFQNCVCHELDVTVECKKFSSIRRTELAFITSNTISINKQKSVVSTVF